MPTIKQEVTDEACVPAPVSRPLSSMQKVPSLSDLSDPESSLGKSIFTFLFFCQEISATRFLLFATTYPSNYLVLCVFGHNILTNNMITILR